MIKWQILLLSMLFSVTRIIGQNCDFTVIPTSDRTTIIDASTMPGIGPGKTVCLLAGEYYQILIRNINGIEGAPIVIRNTGGQVVIQNDAQYGLTMRNCSHIKILGNGHFNTKYGISIQRVENGNGISADRKTTDFELAWIEISNTLYAGIMAKTDPDCTFSAVRDSFLMRNIIIRDCFIHNTGMEGMYIGNVFYTGYTLNCNGRDTLVFPHLINGVNIFDNVVMNTGWDGIQVSSASNNCRIFRNYVKNDSQLEEPDQMSGLLIGGGSRCDCSSNTISHGKGGGIEIFGKGNIKIFNNLIENPGRSYRPHLPATQFPKHGIFVGHIATDPSAWFYIMNNTIVNPKTQGIRFTNPISSGNVIQNNIIINPGSFPTAGALAYIQRIPASIPATISHNFLALDTTFAKFTDPRSSKYSLRSDSPAIDAGTNLSWAGVNFDIYGYPRPYGDGFDIGAFEHHPAFMNLPALEEQSESLMIYPNPSKGNIYISFTLLSDSFVHLSIIDKVGRSVFSWFKPEVSAGNHKIPVNLNPLHPCLYLVKLNTVSGQRIEKLLTTK